MKLVVIYGPPAVGKLTVAKELAKITNLKVFHNHYSIDILEPLMKFGTENFWRYSDKIRTEVFKIAEKENINLIFTICYAHDLEGDQGFIRKTVRLIKKSRGDVFFVQLKTDMSNLEKRVKGHSRKNYSKLKNIKKLRATMKKYNLTSSVIHKPNLIIDNSKISAKRAAQMIKKHYKL